MKVRARLDGTASLKAVLNVLGPKVYRPAARKGVRQAGQIVAKAAKANVPNRTNTLRKAIGFKVKSTKGRTGYMSIIGPRKDAKGTWTGGTGKTKTKFRRWKKVAGKRRYLDPAKYAHLVEGGRAAVRITSKRVLSDGRNVWGTHARMVPATHFMRNAYDANIGAIKAALWQCFHDATVKAGQGGSP